MRTSPLCAYFVLGNIGANHAIVAFLAKPEKPNVPKDVSENEASDADPLPFGVERWRSALAA